MRGETLRQQLAALESQRDIILEMDHEAHRALAALEHFATAKEGDETLVPLGAGAFVHARLASPQVAIASLGSGIHAEVPAQAARDRMRARLESLEGVMGQLEKEIGRVSDELTRINAMLEQVYGT